MQSISLKVNHMKFPGRLRTASVLAPVVLLALSGCASPHLANTVARAVSEAPAVQVDQLTVAGVKGGEADIKARNAKAASVQVVRRASAPWIGGAMVPVTKEDGLPALFNEPYTLEFGEGKVSLGVIAARLTKMTNVPVRIRSDVNQAPNAAVATKLASSQSQNPSAVSANEAMSLDAVSMRWSGRLRDFIDNLTNTLSLSWEYRDGAVVILRNLTQTYTVAGLVGQQTFDSSTGSSATGTAGGAGTSSSMQASGSFNEKGQLDGFGSIYNTVKAIVGNGPGVSIVSNTQTGTLVVTASKEIQSQVRDYMEEQNKLLRRMVNITMDIYTVKDTESDSQGINWNVVFNSMSKDYGIGVSSPASLSNVSAGAITLTGLGGEGAGTTAIFNALRQSGKSVEHTPISMNTMNGKLKVQSSTSTQGYVKETTPGVAGVSGTAGAPGLKTDTVTTGAIYSILPIIQPDNSVLLKYNFRLSNLLGIVNFTSGTGVSQQTVQVPQTDSVGDGTDVRLMPGEAVLITGLSRLVNTSDSNRVAEGASIALGGSSRKTSTRENFVVLLRATPY